MSKAILVIDDEKTIRWSLGEALQSTYDVFDADSGEKGLRLFKEKSADLVLIDLKLPDENGITILRALKEHDPSLPVIMMTAYGEVETAVEAMKAGAYDFVLKPFALEKLKVTIGNALEARNLKDELAYLKRTSGKSDFKDFIGQSKAMAQIFEARRTLS
jgi:DNA-binding NtrC family response regulator